MGKSGEEALAEGSEVREAREVLSQRALEVRWNEKSRTSIMVGKSIEQIFEEDALSGVEAEQRSWRGIWHLSRSRRGSVWVLRPR